MPSLKILTPIFPHPRHYKYMYTYNMYIWGCWTYHIHVNICRGKHLFHAWSFVFTNRVSFVAKLMYTNTFSKCGDENHHQQTENGWGRPNISRLIILLLWYCLVNGFVLPVIYEIDEVFLKRTYGWIITVIKLYVYACECTMRGSLNGELSELVLRIWDFV